MHEIPDSNFDDSGPKSVEELARSSIARQQAGEKLYLVLYGGRPVGAIGYAKVTEIGGVFRGICFTQDVHGSGVPLAAVKMMLKEVFDGGVQSVVAIVFADNFRVRWFLNKLGALAIVSELKDAIRGGKPVRLRAYRIQACDFYALHEYPVHKDVPDPTGVLGGIA